MLLKAKSDVFSFLVDQKLLFLYKAQEAEDLGNSEGAATLVSLAEQIGAVTKRMAADSKEYNSPMQTKGNGTLGVCIEHTDGYIWTTKAENLEEAQRIIENEAIAARENCPDKDVNNIFPMYWSIKGGDKEIVASGHVNEHGEMVG